MGSNFLHSSERHAGFKDIEASMMSMNLSDQRGLLGSVGSGRDVVCSLSRSFNSLFHGYEHDFFVECEKTVVCLADKHTTCFHIHRSFLCLVVNPSTVVLSLRNGW